IHSLGHRVGSRRLQPSIRLGLELLQLLPDLGLGAPGDLAPDARTVRAPAERDRTDPGAVRSVPVDRPSPCPRRAVAVIRRIVRRLWLLVWLCFEAFKIALGL